MWGRRAVAASGRAHQQVLQLLPGLTAAIDAGGDFSKAQVLLRDLKILLTELPSSSNEELCLHRDVLEAAVMLSIKSDDTKAFERSYAQLRPVYQSLSTSAAPAAIEKRRLVVGLYLIHLLVEARLAEFHSEVELVAAGERVTPFIAFPVMLENFLMEGSYNKILSARSSMPSPLYAPFMARLTETVRDDIAECGAASYASLSVADAQALFKFGSLQELGAYIQQRRPNWKIRGDIIEFNTPSAEGERKGRVGAAEAPAFIQTALHYAVEVERIV